MPEIITNFIPTGDKIVQHEALDAVLHEAGFAYEPDGDYFYSLKDCWQRECGYCKLYDDACRNLNMVTDAEPFTFSFGGKRWLIEFWKGQYGITTGCEIGIYNTDKENVVTEQFTGAFYDCITDAEMMPMAFKLYKKGKLLLERSGTAWWLTAFRLGEFSHRRSLVMDTEITFPSVAMAQAFAAAVADVGYKEDEYSIENATVKVHFTKPHTKAGAMEKAQEFAVQKINDVNTALYKKATERFPNTMDALEYLQAAFPALFEFMLNSLYAHALFKAFDWLRTHLFKRSKSSAADPPADPPARVPAVPLAPIRYFNARPIPAATRYFNAVPDPDPPDDPPDDPPPRRYQQLSFDPPPAPSRRMTPLPYQAQYVSRPAAAPRLVPTRARGLPRISVPPAYAPRLDPDPVAPCNCGCSGNR